MEVLRQIDRIAEKFRFAEQRPTCVELAIGFAETGDFDSALRTARRFGRGRSAIAT